MSHELLRISEKVFNTPHLMHPHALDRALEYLDERNSGKIEFAIQAPRKDRHLQYMSETGVGIIPVQGPLTNVAYEGLCGEVGCSYEQIEDTMIQLVEEGATTVVLDIDSGGGEAYRMMETGRWLRKYADDHGVKLLAYVDGLAASAAYGIAVSAHEIIANDESDLGSIGVVVKLRNFNKAMQKMGVEDTYLYAGDSKIPFDADGDWRKEFLEDIQEKIDTLYTKFTHYVAEMRGIDEESVRKTQAKVFDADKAVALGLADDLMTREMFSEYLATLVETRENNNMKFLKRKTGTQMNLEELQTEFDLLKASTGDMKTQLDQATALLAENEVAMTALKEELETVKADKAALEAAQEEQALSAAVAKQEARKERLVKAVGSEKAEALTVKFESMDDESFDLVASSFEEQAKLLADSDAMKELGISGEGDSVEGQKTGVQLALEQLRKQKRK